MKFENQGRNRSIPELATKTTINQNFIQLELNFGHSNVSISD